MPAGIRPLQPGSLRALLHTVQSKRILPRQMIPAKVKMMLPCRQHTEGHRNVGEASVRQPALSKESLREPRGDLDTDATKNRVPADARDTLARKTVHALADQDVIHATMPGVPPYRGGPPQLRRAPKYESLPWAPTLSD